MEQLQSSDRAFLRCEEIKQKFLHEHLLKDDHHGFGKDVSICPIDKDSLLTHIKESTLGGEYLRRQFLLDLI